MFTKRYILTAAEDHNSIPEVIRDLKDLGLVLRDEDGYYTELGLIAHDVIVDKVDAAHLRITGADEAIRAHEESFFRVTLHYERADDDDTYELAWKELDVREVAVEVALQAWDEKEK